MTRANRELIILYWLLTSVFATLIALGVLLDAAASNWQFTGASRNHFVHALVALATLAIFAVLPLWLSLRFVTFLVLSSCLLLPFLLLFAEPMNNARRWFDLGFAHFQPSEFIKVLLPVIFARAISLNEVYRRANFPFILLLAYLPISLLVLLQPDFGQALLIITGLSVQFLLAGFALQALLAFGVALGAVSLTLSPFLAGSLGHVAYRLNQFFNGGNDAPTQLDLARNLIENGGFFGSVSENTLNFPHAQSDFVYALVAGNFGLLGSATLLFAVSLVCLSCIYVVNRKFLSDVILRHMVSGIAVVTMLQVFAHSYSNLGLLPTKGTTFPFLSRGGSSLTAFAVGWGLVAAALRTSIRKNPGQ